MRSFIRLLLPPKTLRALSVVFIAALLLVSCGEKSPVAPTPVPVAACVTNNTGDISFGNRSATVSMDIIWNGVKLTYMSPIAPGATSTPLTAAAGVAHTVLFRVANTSTLACSQASPVLTQCASTTMTCSGGQ
jgi:hypothetical protein